MLADRRDYLGLVALSVGISLDGKQIGDFRKALKTVCKKTGLIGSYCLRPKADRRHDLVKAGVVERVPMSLSGHKTRSLFDRYNNDRVYSVTTTLKLDAQKREKIPGG